MFGLTGSDIFHGALSLDQLFSARPHARLCRLSGSLKGLYLCGWGFLSGESDEVVLPHSLQNQQMAEVSPALVTRWGRFGRTE